MSNKIEIESLDTATGWVIVQAKPESDPSPDRLSYALNQSVVAWSQQNPTLSIQATLPIVSQGNTVAVHLWF
jgi:hypothetical protein